MQAYSDPMPVNVGAGEDLAIVDLARLVMEVIGHDGELLTDPYKPDGTPRKLLDCSRLTALGWKASIPLCDGIARTYEAFLAGDGRGI
jgi:GDP-L-fucose synthase